MRWFLSYHSPEQRLAERLKAAVEQKDPESQVFFAPTSLRAGRSWTRALADEINGADAFILLVGESGLGDWQVLEYDEALDRWVKSPDFPLIFVLLEGQTAPGLQFLRRLHWIVAADPSSEKTVGLLLETARGGAPGASELWRHVSPYRGLAAMEEKDSDYFFGREDETREVLSTLAEHPDRLAILIGNSGVGKSSIAGAGVLAALKRQAWPEGLGDAGPWPPLFHDSRLWSFLTLRPGGEPLKALVECFLDGWGYSATDPERVKRQNGWIELLCDDKASLSDLLDATERRRRELGQPSPPAFFLYVDQGEELYARSESTQARRFSRLLAQALADKRLRAMMSMRADFLGALQSDEPLFSVRRMIDVAPLREDSLKKVVTRPAELLSARFESPVLPEVIARRTFEDSVKDVGALPLLSYTLDDMWTRTMQVGDGVLRLGVQSFELGAVLVERADAFLATHLGSEPAIRRIFTLRLANLREDGEPTRRRAPRAEFTDGEWRLASELADHPNRLLAIVAGEGGESFAEIAHETVFRRWDKLRGWIASEREFLAWRSGLEAARRAWRSAAGPHKDQALLMGFALSQAKTWLDRRAEDLSPEDRAFIERSLAADAKQRKSARRVQALVYALVTACVVGVFGWRNQTFLESQITWYAKVRPFIEQSVRPYELTAQSERALKSGATFAECAKNCPEMTVIPAGAFMMGSEDAPDEEPAHKVTIAAPFAVATFDVTFDQWDLCVRLGGCRQVSDTGFGRGKNPVVNVTWSDAEAYAAWLSQITGEPYRLLSEAEWEYAARGGSQTPYYWGSIIGKNRADCDGCGSKWDNDEVSPVGSFAPNAFGLYDMAGDVWQWVADCEHPNYVGAPAVGSVWIDGDCSKRADRGGSWVSAPALLRSANRAWDVPDDRSFNRGFRVARTLLAAP